jgi:hypothetical protein
MVKEYLPGFGLQDESPGGTNCDAGSTMSALGFVTDDILAQGLDFYPGLGEVFYTLVIILSLAAQLQNQQPFLSWRYGSLNDAKGETEILDQAANDRLARHTGRKVEYYPSRNVHLYKTLNPR